MAAWLTVLAATTWQADPWQTNATLTEVCAMTCVS